MSNKVYILAICDKDGNREPEVFYNKEDAIKAANNYYEETIKDLTDFDADIDEEQGCFCITDFEEDNQISGEIYEKEIQ